MCEYVISLQTVNLFSSIYLIIIKKNRIVSGKGSNFAIFSANRWLAITTVVLLYYRTLVDNRDS